MSKPKTKRKTKPKTLKPLTPSPYDLSANLPRPRYGGLVLCVPKYRDASPYDLSARIVISRKQLFAAAAEVLRK